MTTDGHRGTGVLPEMAGKSEKSSKIRGSQREIVSRTRADRPIPTHTKNTIKLGKDSGRNVYISTQLVDQNI